MFRLILGKCVVSMYTMPITSPFNFFDVYPVFLTCFFFFLSLIIIEKEERKKKELPRKNGSSESETTKINLGQ